VHIPYQYTLSIDLSNFFDSVRQDQLTPYLPDEIVDLILVNNAPRQGLPTSPAACNIAAAPLDQMIAQAAGARGCVYTRYVDDIAISGDSLRTLLEMRKVVQAAVSQMGWQVNPRKTRILWSGAGRRIICGVAVDAQGLHPTRSTRRRLRAAQHQADARPHDRRQQRRVAGLREWATLRSPNPHGRRERTAWQRAESTHFARLINGKHNVWA
jgi:hypothetical protein